MKAPNQSIEWSSDAAGNRFISSLRMGSYQLSFNPNGTPYQFKSYSGIVKTYSGGLLNMIVHPGKDHVISCFYDFMDGGNITITIIRNKYSPVRIETGTIDASKINLDDYDYCRFSSDEVENLREILSLMGKAIQHDPHQALHDCLMMAFESGLKPF